MAERFGLAFLLLLRAAEFFTDRAIFFGSDCLKTFFFRSIASLCFVTAADHFFFVVMESSLASEVPVFPAKQNPPPLRGWDRPPAAKNGFPSPRHVCTSQPNGVQTRLFCIPLSLSRDNF
jgi:hypothetical protein